MEEMIRSARLLIRPIEVNDWAAIRQVWLDFEASGLSCYDTPHRTEPEAVRETLRGWVNMMQAGYVHDYAVVHDDSVIGFVGLRRSGDYLEFSYGFQKQAQGNGYAFEAMEALMAWYAAHGYTRFLAGTAIRNYPSVALLRRLGFHLAVLQSVSFYRDENGKKIRFEGGYFTKEYVPGDREPAYNELGE